MPERFHGYLGQRRRQHRRSDTSMSAPFPRMPADIGVLAEGGRRRSGRRTAGLASREWEANRGEQLGGASGCGASGR